MSFLQRRGARVTLTALAVAGLGFSIPLLQAAADPSPTAACLEAGNVWVLVQNDDATAGGCATKFGTGFEALTSAGFDFNADDAGFINKIDGVPGTKGPQDWWAYAHADEDLAEWQFYEVGGASSEPAAGSIEAWRLIHSWEAEDTYPSITPEQLLADVEPNPSPSPSPEASVTASATPSPSPSASALPVPSATASLAPQPSLPNTGN